jgi:hypothetical protein
VEEVMKKNLSSINKMLNKELELRKRESEILKAKKENLKVEEENLKIKKDLLKKQEKEMYKKEEDFFSKQVGKYFKSKSGKRFFHILCYGFSSYYNYGLFEVKYYDLGNNIEKSVPISVYSVFGLDFETKEITEEEYLKNLKENKNEI